MSTRKKSQPATKRTSKAAATSGPVPPYGDPIRKAIARGDTQEMRKVAASGRRYLSEVQSALDALNQAIKKLGS
jgi:hypothetical protein